MNYETLGNRLKSVREIYKMSQTEVATKLGVTQTYIHRIETGKGCNGDFLIKVLDFYSQYISLDRLFDEGKPISEAVLDELKEPSLNIRMRRQAEVRRSVDILFEEMKNDVEKMKRIFNAKMDSLEN